MSKEDTVSDFADGYAGERQIKAMEKDIRDLKVERGYLLFRLSAARERITELEAAESREAALTSENEVLTRTSSVPARQLAELHLRNEKRLTARIKELESREAALREALEKYSRHEVTCKAWRSLVGVCDCGLEAALAPDSKHGD